MLSKERSEPFGALFGREESGALEWQIKASL